MTDFPRGRRLALDVGRARIGVAVSDPDGILATPVETVRAAEDGSEPPPISKASRRSASTPAPAASAENKD